MRVPTSVLLAVLVAAGLLALAPALVRRYDATERLVAERASSTARVLERRRRRRSVPGRQPINPSRVRSVALRSAAPAPAASSGAGSPLATSGGRSAASGGRSATSGGRRDRVGGLRVVPPRPAARRTPARRPVRRHPIAVYRRRRVFAALLLLNIVEMVGVMAVGPGFWISFAVTIALLGAYTVHLRNRTLDERRRRRAQAREAAWLAARQAEVRREQARRAAARRENQRRLAAQRESVRRAALGMDHGLPMASGGATVSYRRAGGLRGRAYQAGRPGAHSA
ncbi:MAG TPA: hypothetical protein VFR67_28745 [Pilimelia sp.]|nr:hypothetical protein [Pilimelia sp.]